MKQFSFASVVVASFILFGLVSGLNGIVIQPHETASINVSGPTESPFSPVDISLWQLVLAAVPWIIYALKELLQFLKDRNWKKKYDEVVVVKPL